MCPWWFNQEHYIVHATKYMVYYDNISWSVHVLSFRGGGGTHICSV